MTSIGYDLFCGLIQVRPEPIGKQSMVLREFAAIETNELLECVNDIEKAAPFRQMLTPGGFTMSVAMTNCGRLGWTTDRRGYRYTENDPVTGLKWPAMPKLFEELAQFAAMEAGFPDYNPDACLINRYLPGSRLTLHQDKNEKDFDAPIVSVSLGMPAIFLFGGLDRGDKATRIPLSNGDVVVWGGKDRLRYHGVMPMKSDPHPLVGEQRINLTFRKAG